MSRGHVKRFWMKAHARKWKTCHYCGNDVSRSLPMDDPNRATIDHVFPLSAGGTNALKNLVLACLKCNRSKSDAVPPRTAEELRPWRFQSTDPQPKEIPCNSLTACSSVPDSRPLPS